MNREKLQRLIEDFTDTSPLNRLGSVDGDVLDDNYAKNNLYTTDITAEMMASSVGSYKGMRFYQHGIFSIVRADDPGFAELKRPEIVGPHQFMPQDWLPEAKTVISFFLPFERAIVESNILDPVKPSKEWTFARVDGQRFLLALGTAVKNALIDEGYKAVTPYTEDRMIMRVGRETPAGGEYVPEYSSNWSERHVGYVAGLGTFGLHTNFISRLGCAGRLLSVVTDWEAPSDPHDYDHCLGYCSKCGACIRKCPAEALSLDCKSKDMNSCGVYIINVSKEYAPRLGCGKCQCGLPCSYHDMKKK